MNNYQTAKTSKRFFAFLIDFLIIALVAQLLSLIFGTQLENLFHVKASLDKYYEIGINMGVFTDSLQTVEGVSSELIQQFQNNSDVQKALAEYHNGQFYMNTLLFGVGYIIFQFIIPLIFKDGRSIGKILFKLKVVRKDDKPITFVNLLLRSIVGMFIVEFAISMKFMFLPFTISCSLVLAGESKRALHDYIAGTKVIGFETDEAIAKAQAKQDAKKNPSDPHHKTYKGFEFIDIEALEENERRGQAPLNKGNKNVEAVDATVEEKKTPTPSEETSEGHHKTRKGFEFDDVELLQTKPLDSSNEENEDEDKEEK